jgi:hypothetical protein
MTIAARFDLEMIQYDVVNAFVHAELPYKVYMRQPPGFRTPGKILLLRKALYGLRESPLLWQRHFTQTIKDQGFRQVPHEPCCFLRDGVIIFVYVDDIVVAYRKKNEENARRAISAIKAKYSLQGGEDLQWFLGVEVLRDRKKRLIWLSQSDYIAKLAGLREKTERATKPSTPMTVKEWLPYEGVASASSVNLYQRKTGSILYAAVITRPDIAFAISRLTRFNLNPSPEHHAAATRIINYLLSTRFHALELGGGDTLETWSDASFADNSTDRKSSQAYVIRLFGGTIAWRANKQDTVTTSTTEAELLSLAQAAKEALFLGFLLKELEVELDDTSLQVWCDNTQTISLVNREIATLQTKLRHVDIHNHWLREAAAKDQIHVDYLPTKEMLADGLTKALYGPTFERFRKQIGLVDIEPRIKARQLKELGTTDLEELEDHFDGGLAE